MPRLSVEEIDFRRLLKCTEQLVAQGTKLQDPHQARSFQRLSVLQQKLAVLEEWAQEERDKAAPEREISLPVAVPKEDSLREYRRKLKALSDFLPENIPKLEALEELALAQDVKHAEEDKRKRSLLTHVKKGANGKEVKKKEKTPDSFHPPSASEVKALIKRDEVEREKMTDDMVALAQQLKQIHSRTGDQLKKDDTNLSSLGEALEKNLHSTEMRKKAVEELLEASSGTTLLYCTIIILVVLSFMGMFVFIKIFPKVS